MNYKRDLIDELRSLPNLRASIGNLNERIKILKLERESIKSARTDGDPVSGGGTNRREEMLINNLYEDSVRKKTLEINERRIAQLEACLASLLPNERTVLERFYIYSESHAADKLARDLSYDRSQIYNIKDAALRNMALMLYGDE